MPKLSDQEKQEAIRVPKGLDLDDQQWIPGTEPAQQRWQEWDEVWTGDYIFESEWQC